MKKLMDDALLEHIGGGSERYGSDVYTIDQDRCAECGICYAECPIEAIVQNGTAYKIVLSRCLRCGVCKDVCPKNAILYNWAG